MQFVTGNEIMYRCLATLACMMSQPSTSRSALGGLLNDAACVGDAIAHVMRVEMSAWEGR
jgi:hypothetical protein